MIDKRKILITGKAGQLGAMLLQSAPVWADVIALDRHTLDLTSQDAIRRVVKEIAPHVIINSAAHTAVDRAETEQDLARSINTTAVGLLAEEAARLKAKLVHFSTDYVFDGQANTPYKPDAKKNPQSVYGLTKSDGEDIISEKLEKESYLIIRTAWVYTSGGKNFVETMLKLMRLQNSLRVIADQVGTPTAAFNLAEAAWLSIQRGLTGVHHFTDSGVATWYDFACDIARLAHRKGLISTLPEIKPIASVDYPQAAKRPTYAVLDKQSFWDATGYKPEHWSDALERLYFK